MQARQRDDISQFIFTMFLCFLNWWERSSAGEMPLSKINDEVDCKRYICICICCIYKYTMCVQ